MAIIGSDILFAANNLKQGKLVAIPTETVYGLAANAFNEGAIKAVFAAKNRPNYDPLIVHAHSIQQIKTFVNSISPALLKLANAFWPGPLTLLLPKAQQVSLLITAGLETVAVRVPNHPLTLQLLQTLDFPIVAPSANPFGYISPTMAAHVQQQLGDKLDYILDGGSCKLGVESTIVGEQDNEIYIFRLGSLTQSDIENVLQATVKLKINKSSNPTAPGQLKKHYAPKKPIIIGDLNKLQLQYYDQKIGILCFGKTTILNSNNIVFNLSETENLSEATANLYNHLRLLDHSDVTTIITNFISDDGLGATINDRLQRASSK